MIITCKERVSVNSNVIIKANTSGIGMLSNLITPLISDINVVNIEIDVIKIESSTVILKFTSQVSVTSNDNTHLIFLIKRYKNNKYEKVIGESYTFSCNNKALTTKTFIFQTIDNDVYSGRYNYCVQISKDSIIGNDTGVSIINATLSAIVS